MTTNLEIEMVTGILESLGAPAIIITPDYQIQATNQLYRAHYNVGTEIVGRRCYEVSHHNTVPCDQAGEHCPMQAAAKSAEARRVLHIHHTSSGNEHVDVETRPIHNDQGKLICFIEIIQPVPGVSTRSSTDGMVGHSPAFNRMLELIRRVAPNETTALLLGESGTGKELVAQAIHNQSLRSDAKFIPVECSGLTETLFESELFGHEKGAFTGAQTRHEGLVAAARGGTLFLDEVGDIPLLLQVKLLRLLETGTYRRVGGVEPQQADFRLICATHRNLQQMVADGSFRQDLFYRISAFPITLPPLRERQEDMPLLVNTLLGRIPGAENNHLTADALKCLQQYTFPGNVRELRNMLERASLLADGETIKPEHLPDVCQNDSNQDVQDDVHGQLVTLDEAEQRYLKHALEKHHGDRSSLARKLGVSERTLFRKLKAIDNRNSVKTD
ncbi:MAG: sigma-54-dependent Fis family transcriptional regulator [Gammaproteobacteria bacterium]|nr:MAG: sigma-54-dependent Fis family transcriptional regulator [Gammaproteobacteria bacterium]